jgi:hypothetical protein
VKYSPNLAASLSGEGYNGVLKDRLYSVAFKGGK